MRGLLSLLLAPRLFLHAFIPARSPSYNFLTRRALSFKLPRDIDLPLDKIEFSYARSSGPGGQNVNKVNTKAEMRFHVMDADWLPIEVRKRLADYQVNKINNKGELVVTSQESRTQSQNREDCILKLQTMIAEAYVEPKERAMWEGLSQQGKTERKQEKRKRGDVKASRSNKSFDYDD